VAAGSHPDADRPRHPRVQVLDAHGSVVTGDPSSAGKPAIQGVQVGIGQPGLEVLRQRGLVRPHRLGQIALVGRLADLQVEQDKPDRQRTARRGGRLVKRTLNGATVRAAWFSRKPIGTRKGSRRRTIL
jgi:hypothetical protein